MKRIILALAMIPAAAYAMPMSDNYPQTFVAQENSAKKGRPTADRDCLTPTTRDTLTKMERKFRPVKIISTCRPGARIAGTNKISQHAHGNAVDFMAPRGRKAEVVRWLRENNSGLVMTYSRMGHIHFDTGPHIGVACGGCRKKRK